MELYVNFSVSGTAIPGVDYVALVSPAYIGQSGYGVIQVKTLPDPRGSAFRQAYSVVVTLKPGAGYAVGKPSSATMWIKPGVESSNSLDGAGTARYAVPENLSGRRGFASGAVPGDESAVSPLQLF